MLVHVVRVAAVLNVLLLGVALFVWGRNWVQVRSKRTFGLVLFGAFLMGENLLAVYWFTLDPALSWWIIQEDMVTLPAQVALATLRVLQSIGLAFLAWITWD